MLLLRGSVSRPFYRQHTALLRHCTRFNQTLVELKNASVHRFGALEPAFKDLSLTLSRDQRMVITGPVSAGKTTLAEALAGRHLIKPLTAARWPALEEAMKAPDASPYPSDHIHLVSFKEESSLFSYSGHYYQERFNFSDPDNDLTLRSYLEASQKSSKKTIDDVARQLDIDHLLDLSFVKLSNGQTRRARLARALLRDPKMLILDEPLMGLDVQHRERLLGLLGNLANDGLPIVLVLRPQDEIPSWATDVVTLNQMQIAWHGQPEEYLAERKVIAAKEKAEKEAYLDKMKKLEDTPREPVVELRNVNVVYSGNKILDSISWTVKEGERWALIGPNGSGKTTLLSFLTGDHPQAYANDLFLFGRKRGTGESIWDIKQRVGLVSPEIHLYFNQALTGLEAAGTGFFDVVSPRKLSPEQTQIIERLFGEFKLESFLSRRLRDMSTGEQRMVLLIRSLVKMPKLIIWDEPFQGLDDGMIKNVNQWLEDHMRPEQSLILVTHHEEEIPRAVTKRFALGPGGVDANKK